MIFGFLNEGNILEEDDYFMTGEKFVKFKFHCPSVKFSWNSVCMYVHSLWALWIVSGFFQATRAQLSHCNRRIRLTKTKNRHYLALYGEHFAEPDADHGSPAGGEQRHTEGCGEPCSGSRTELCSHSLGKVSKLVHLEA